MQQTINRRWAVLFWSLLAFPTAYVFGASFLFDSAEPLLQRLAIKESLGFNINLLILFGPLLAFWLNLFALVKFEWFNTEKNYAFKISIKKHLVEYGFGNCIRSNACHSFYLCIKRELSLLKRKL